MISTAPRNSTGVTDGLAVAFAALAERVFRSLVMVKVGQHGIGAGIIWLEGGWVLTNFHVVRHGTPLLIQLDGRRFAAQISAADEEIDLALLEADGLEAPPAQIADDRNLQIGELVFALGHPWGQPGWVTVGILSRLDRARTRGRRGSIPVLYTDVQLAPGNSGGPLVNAMGAVVGINTMVLGGDLGVAIPSHIAEAFVEEALAKAGGRAGKGRTGTATRRSSEEQLL